VKHYIMDCLQPKALLDLRTPHPNFIVDPVLTSVVWYGVCVCVCGVCVCVCVVCAKAQVEQARKKKAVGVLASWAGFHPTFVKGQMTVCTADAANNKSHDHAAGRDAIALGRPRLTRVQFPNSISSSGAVDLVVHQI
jgi:hypothetical protein